jgi:hypothetical protein
MQSFFESDPSAKCKRTAKWSAYRGRQEIEEARLKRRDCPISEVGPVGIYSLERDPDVFQASSLASYTEVF